MTALAKLPPLPDTELLTTLGRDAYTDQQMRDYARAAIAALSPAEPGGVEAVAWMIDAEFVDAGKVRTFSATKPNPDMWGKATFTPLYATTPRAAEAVSEEVQDAVDSILSQLGGWAKAYPLDIFSEPTDEEREWLHTTKPGLMDRIAASMGRHVAKCIAEDLAALTASLTPPSAKEEL